jgi:hypothetical protein
MKKYGPKFSEKTRSLDYALNAKKIRQKMAA